MNVSVSNSADVRVGLKDRRFTFENGLLIVFARYGGGFTVAYTVLNTTFTVAWVWWCEAEELARGRVWVIDYLSPRVCMRAPLHSLWEHSKP